MRLILLGLLLCVVLFFAGLLFPRRSRKLQEKVGKYLRRGERKGDERAGKLGDATNTALKKTRKATEHSADAGRAVNQAGQKAGRSVRDKLSR